MMENENKSIQQKVIIAVLVIIFAANLWHTNHKNSARNSAGMEKASLTVGALRLFPLDRKLTDYSSLPVRDPLQLPIEYAILEEKYKAPSAKVPEGKTDLSLDGVIWGGNKNMAIISGNVVVEGDMIGSAKVIKIEEGKVLLRDNERDIELRR